VNGWLERASADLVRAACTFLWLLLFLAFGGVLLAVTYANLRQAKEGATADEVGSVFE